MLKFFWKLAVKTIFFSFFGSSILVFDFKICIWEAKEIFDPFGLEEISFFSLVHPIEEVRGVFEERGEGYKVAVVQDKALKKFHKFDDISNSFDN